MKTTIASIFLLFFLFSAKSCLSQHRRFLPMFDTDGDEVLPGVPYFMVSAIRGVGGGLDLGKSENHRCPRFVMQHPSDHEFGMPVVLTPTDPRDCRIFEFTDLNISFVPGFDPLCRASTTWTVDYDEHSTEKAWINTGGGAFGGWFRVYPVQSGAIPNTYNLGACFPQESQDIYVSCDAVDRFEGKSRRIGFEKFRSEGWLFMFVKAPVEAIEHVGGKEAM